MPRRYNIKWRESDDAELKKVVKNYNAKISRLEKKDPKNKNALPEKISVRQMKELISTRQDLNRELNSLRRFSRRGAEEFVPVPDNDYNLKITKWQKEEMIRRAATNNLKRKRQREKLMQTEMKSGGEKLGYTVGQFGMGKAEEISLRPIKAFTPKMNRADLQKKNVHLMKESQDNYFDRKNELLRENYIKSLRQNYDESDVADVIDTIENMEFDEFYSTFQAEGGTMEWSYPPKASAEYQGYVEQIHSIWTPKK